MSQPSSVSINPSLTSLPGTTGAPTPSTFSQSMGASATVVAVLTDTDAHTTITAYQIASTTGLAVVDGTTLTWRHEGITLGNGDVVSLGFNGLEDSTTTANYRVMTVTSSASGGSGGSEVSFCALFSLGGSDADFEVDKWCKQYWWQHRWRRWRCYGNIEKIDANAKCSQHE